MKTSRFAAAGLVAFAVASSMVLGVAAPANAAAFPPITPVGFHDLTDYAVTISQQQLIELQGKTAAGKAANGAWESTLGRAAAQDAGLYSVATQYGNLPAETIGEVIPLTKKIGDRMFGKLSARLGGIPRPAFPTFAKSLFTRPAVGGVAATVALIAWDSRVQISQGVASWFGTDATGAVCTNTYTGLPGGSEGFVNWVTGQDCNAFQASREFEANKNVDPTAIYGRACDSTDAAWCVTMQGMAEQFGGDPSSHAFCFVTEGAKGRFAHIDFHGVYTPPGAAARAPQYFPNFTVGPLDPNTCVPYPSANSSTYFSSDVKIDSYQFTYGGNVATVTTTASDPEHRLMCQLYGSSGAVTVGYTAPIRESVVALKGWPAPVCTSLAATDIGVRTVITEVDNGAPVVMQDTSEMASAAPARQRDAAAQCDIRTCVYDVVRQSDLVSCFGLGDQCTEWFVDPQRDTNYKCEYGGETTDMKNCYVYANTFNSAKRLAGNPYADPLTGKDPLGGTGPSAGSGLMNNPVRSPDTFRDCAGGTMDISQAFILIGRSIQCGLEWAFVPSDYLMATNASTMKDSWAKTAPGQVITAVSSWNLDFSVSGCSGVPFPFTFTTSTGSASTNMGLPSACAGTPLAPFAGWVRTLGAFAFVIGSAFAVRRNAAASIDYHTGGA